MPFKNIIDQDTSIKALKNMITNHRVAGSYLFLGPDGVGKRTAAIEFAKTINCENGKEDSCSNCNSCRKIYSMNHPDVISIFPEGASCSIKIEKIRDIIYQSSLKPYEGKKKVFIINDAEGMTKEAQNALLKILEEPPENHILILTASNISGLLSTVISRCKVLKFYSLNQDSIKNFLQEKDVPESEALLFSHMAMGSIGRALDFKERNIIEQRDKVINDFFLRKSALLREDVLAEHLSEDVEESLYMLLCWYRDLLVSKLTKDEDKLLNIDRSSEISSYADRFSEEKLEKDILGIMKTMGYLKSNLNPKIALFDMALGLKRN